MAEEMIPCPYCGGLIVGVEVRYFDILNRRQLFYGECSCGAQGPTAFSREDAAAKWNRRALSVPGLGGGDPGRRGADCGGQGREELGE